MKRAIVTLVAVFAVLGLMSFARADDKEVTLKGELQCAKCALGEKIQKCHNALVVKEGDKKITYHLERNAESNKYDAKVCGGAKIPVAVTGMVAEKDGKKMLTAKKITEG